MVFVDTAASLSLQAMLTMHHGLKNIIQHSYTSNAFLLLSFDCCRLARNHKDDSSH